jgi:hypothetical protein
MEKMKLLGKEKKSYE